MTILARGSCKNSTRPWLYYGSLLAVLLLSLASHCISAVAFGQHSHLIENIGLYVICQYSAMAGFMLLAWYTSPNATSLNAYKAMFVVAIIARFVLMDISPYTSNDVDRYLFDGRIAYDGYDPYQISHDDEMLIELRNQWQPPAEHAAYATLYPPVSLALFAFCSSFGVEEAQQAWQWLLLFVGLLTVGVSALVLRKAKKLKHFALIALSPLLILETGVGLHVDAISALAVISAIYLWQHKSHAFCGAVIGLGMSIKILPVMLLLPFFFSQETRKGAAKLVLNCVLTVMCIYGITYGLGYYPVGSIGVFFEKWRSASPLFTLIDAHLSGTHTIILIISIIALSASTIAYLCFRNRFPVQQNNVQAIIYACMQFSIALPLLISPVVFPWYLMPLIPVLALWPNLYLIGWMILMPLTYEVLGNFLAHQVWKPAQWPIVILGLWYLFTLFNIISSLIKRSKFSHTNSDLVRASLK